MLRRTFFGIPAWMWLVAIAVLGIWWWRRRQQQQAQADTSTTDSTTGGYDTTSAYDQSSYGGGGNGSGWSGSAYNPNITGGYGYGIPGPAGPPGAQGPPGPAGKRKAPRPCALTVCPKGFHKVKVGNKCHCERGQRTSAQARLAS